MDTSLFRCNVHILLLWEYPYEFTYNLPVPLHLLHNPLVQFGQATLLLVSGFMYVRLPPQVQHFFVPWQMWHVLPPEEEFVLVELPRL